MSFALYRSRKTRSLAVRTRSFWIIVTLLFLLANNADFFLGPWLLQWTPILGRCCVNSWYRKRGYHFSSKDPAGLREHYCPMSEWSLIFIMSFSVVFLKMAAWTADVLLHSHKIVSILLTVLRKIRYGRTMRFAYRVLVLSINWLWWPVRPPALLRHSFCYFHFGAAHWVDSHSVDTHLIDMPCLLNNSGRFLSKPVVSVFPLMVKTTAGLL